MAEIIRLGNQYQIAGFFDDTESAPHRYLDLPVYHSFDALPEVPSGERLNAVVAIGDCHARMHMAQKIQDKGLVLTAAIHPRAIVSADASLGEGTVIAAGAIVNPGASLGSNVIVNTGATVDHDCKIADGVHIGPGVHIGGWTTVGTAAWLGIGAILKDRIHVGAGAIIGAGAVVVRDIPDYVMALGVPARPVKDLRH